MLKFLVASILFFSASICFSQSENDPYHLEQTGKLFTIKIIPGAKKTSLFLAGKKAAEINWNDLQIEASIGEEITNSESKRIIFTRTSKNKFSYEGGLKGQTLKLELKNKKKPEEPIDKFFFKVRP